MRDNAAATRQLDHSQLHCIKAQQQQRRRRPISRATTFFFSLRLVTIYSLIQDGGCVMLLFSPVAAAAAWRNVTLGYCVCLSVLYIYICILQSLLPRARSQVL